MSSVISTIVLTVLQCVLMAEKLLIFLGTNVMNVITRVLCLIVLSIAVEFIIKVLAAGFPMRGAIGMFF
jgi:small neutral amino acid transporter SnatA (MarC family)